MTPMTSINHFLCPPPQREQMNSPRFVGPSTLIPQPLLKRLQEFDQRAAIRG